MTTWLAAGILDDLGINLKVWGVQVLIFLATFLVLSRVLFGRVVSHLVRREKDIGDREAKLREDRAEIERLAKAYEKHIAGVEKEAYHRMQAILKEGLDASHEMIARAQKEAHDQLEKARDAIQKERREAGKELHSHVVKMTAEACSRILDMPLEAAQVEPAIQNALKEEN